MCKLLKKGSLAALEGRLQSRSYDNKEEKRIYVTEVVADNVQFLSTSGESRGDRNESNRGSEHRYNQNDMNDPFANDSRYMNIDDDELPF